MREETRETESERVGLGPLIGRLCDELCDRLECGLELREGGVSRS